VTPPRTTTLKHIAAHLDLSVAAVSMALRDHASLPATTIARVKRAALQLNSTPNSAGSALAAHRQQLRVRRDFAVIALVSERATRDGGLQHPRAQRLLAGATARARISGTAMNTPFKEVPMTINIITAELLADMIPADLIAALTFDASITQTNRVPVSNRGDAFAIRGFRHRNVLIDGVTGGDYIPTQMIDRIEVVKGPNTPYSPSDPGGWVNIITKHPQGSDHLNVNLRAGNHGRHARQSRRSPGKGRTLERALHVPLIVRLPRVNGGRATRALADFSDIFPTVLDLADLPRVATEGHSWVRSYATLPDTLPATGSTPNATLPAPRATNVSNWIRTAVSSKSSSTPLKRIPRHRHVIPPLPPRTAHLRRARLHPGSGCDAAVSRLHPRPHAQDCRTCETLILSLSCAFTPLLLFSLCCSPPAPPSPRTPRRPTSSSSSPTTSAPRPSPPSVTRTFRRRISTASCAAASRSTAPT
jgi:hypothetical protein